MASPRNTRVQGGAAPSSPTLAQLFFVSVASGVVVALVIERRRGRRR